MIVNYKSPVVEIIEIFGGQVLCTSPGSSWEGVDREDVDNW
jgi:hypothetical protein